MPENDAYVNPCGHGVWRLDCPPCRSAARLREALELIAAYEVKVTDGALDAYAIQDIARDALDAR